MIFTELAKEGISIPTNAVCSVTVNNTTAETGTVDMLNFNRVMALGILGGGTNATVRAYLQESANSNGVGGTNIAGAIITNIVNTANSMYTLEASAMQLTKRYVKCVVEENQAIAKVLSVVAFGLDPRFHPANGFDSNTVLQRVVSNN